mgnify:FL=1
MAKPYIPYAADLLPSAIKQPLLNNYLSFTDGTGKNFSQQYLPEIYEQEVERYGNRTISSFLRMVGAELPMTSDQVVWSEQNRLHVSTNAGATLDVSNGEITLPANGTDQYRVNQTIVVTDGYNTAKAIIGSISSGTVMIAYTYATNNFTAAGFADGAISLFVYGSEFPKGSKGMEGAIQPAFTQFNNSPIIIKDKYQISGSDAAQIGWVEVAAEDGTSGYLWYLKAEGDTRLRFEDYLEMAVVEGELASGTGALSADGKPVVADNGSYWTTTVKTKGTEGMFAAIQARGNVYQNFDASQGIDDFDLVLKQLDTQGAIEENMLFLNRSTALNFDDMLGSVSQGGYGGTAFGVFENSEEMALNLGFSGFRRGSYDFYKTSWKYLNDASTRGGVAVSGIEGVLIPAGTSTVYDQQLGTNIRRPFLHVRYRASQTEDRRYKNWITGSAGGAYTTNIDAMQVNWLSERCLVTQAANNFVLFQQ